MITRHEITPMAETVLLALRNERRGDFDVWRNCFGMTDVPASTASTRRILARLVKIGYASVERINGRDYWTITEAGEAHWPTDEEIEEYRQKLAALVAKVESAQ